MKLNRVTILSLLLATLFDGCGGGSTGQTTAPGIGTSTPSTSGNTPSGKAIDVTKLPIGDTRMTTTTPAVGYLYTCNPGNPGAGGATAKGPWFNADGTTWNSTTKYVVSGAVSWPSLFAANLSSGVLSVTGNGLPSHTTGTYGIPSTDPVYAYDKNPNVIRAQAMAWGLPGNPQVALNPSCLPMGAIGILLTGARLFNASDAVGRDAAAWEGQDSCQGHPEKTGAYHYHTVSRCAMPADTPGQHSPLVGYIADGFGIYGNLGENGVALTNADLDLCHGHTHTIMVNGVPVIQYHYHATKEFPYTVGCYKGTAVALN